VPAQFRFLTFGQPVAPWRATRREAEEDAIAAELGERDEQYGRFFVTVPGEIVSRPAPQENGPADPS
jgi:hypothetical protein